ncbi:30S ribosomal protein S19 [Candidatus Karelsulcia muelleri]|uniref:30S ribosomal protein S19 n=1 Tax=Candidatus Karelsulcia muelleri TaxID=336810 RepID=UPI00236896E6|nr:30S ribosomal protein S19 [Candidatus Karelsulcia muelleri]WDI79593.1 30S ribosomal protein S19 [Candidatus Karelsulcia muelleri]WDR78915.1 30S ribosomal protein S19 [Candidatus Karelsulcia muelleri]
MPRSLKKGPFVNYKLIKKIVINNRLKTKKIIKTWSRSSTITPEFIGNSIAVHNGKKFITIYISENMVGHKLGEFSHTRNFRSHSGAKKIQKSLHLKKKPRNA